jgi:hypothetical protein
MAMCNRAISWTTRFLTVLLTAASLFGPCLVAPVAAADDVKCYPGDTLIAMDADSIWCRHDADWNGSKGQQLASRFCSIKKKVAADEEAIRQLGFAADAEQFGMFETIATKQRQALISKVECALFDQSLKGADALARSARSLNPWNVNKAVKLLEGKPYGSSLWAAALRKIARVKGKPEMAAAFHDFAEIAEKARGAYETQEAMSDDPDSAQLQLLVGVLKALQGNYEAGLVVTGVEFSESIAYLVYVSGRVDDLAQATDEKLVRLPGLTKRLKRDVDSLLTIRSDWRNEMDIKVDPQCTAAP